MSYTPAKARSYGLRCLVTALVYMAEGVGFEPTVPVKVLRFSGPLPSTTRPSLLRFLWQTLV